jgi:hypothetical protein
MRQPFWLLALGLAVVAMGILLCGTAPEAGSKPTREVVDQGFRIRLDLSGQVLSVDIPEDRGFGGGGTAEAPIAPKLSNVPSSGLVSGSMLAQKAKQFDDGLYAAVELAAQMGSGQFPGKAFLLTRLADRFKDLASAPQGNGLAVLFSACEAGQLSVTVPDPLRAPVQKTLENFLADGLRSKPISFYTWSHPLSSIFRQDRVLQTELEGRASIEALAQALASDAKVRAVYNDYLALVSRLTNPLAYPSLRGALSVIEFRRAPVPDKGLYFFPPSRAHETDLIKKLYGNRPIPEGFSLVDEMVRRIRSGQISLKPTQDSGWYDYQTWAIEPLVIPDRSPEANHLQLSQTYRKQLLEPLQRNLGAHTGDAHQAA